MASAAAAAFGRSPFCSSGGATYEITAALPGDCVAFLTMTDHRGWLCSTPHVDLTAASPQRAKGEGAAWLRVPGGAAPGALPAVQSSKL